MNNLTMQLNEVTMQNLDALVNTRAYLQEELTLLTSPLIATLLLALVLTANLWLFYTTWRKYCYSMFGYAIVVATIVSIIVTVFLYSNNMIEYRNLSQELELVEIKLVDDYDYDL